MTKILFIAFVMSLFFGMTLSTHVPAAAAKPGLAALPQGAPLKTVKGTVKADGDKIAFVADEDKKSWEVMNPETLKRHAGHHVEISAHIYADKNAIHIMSVKMVTKGENGC